MIKTSKNILVSAFDSNFLEYAKMMYLSFKKFNTKTKMYCCDCGLTENDICEIRSIGVTVLSASKKTNVLDKRCYDMILPEFLQTVQWDSLMWADADTLFCKNVEHLFDLKYDFVGHPGRNKNGLIIKCKDAVYPPEIIKTHPENNYYATGMWVTNNKKLLDEFLDWIKETNFDGADSPPMTEIINKGYSSFQLDGNLYNFSRDLVSSGRLDNDGIYYELNDIVFRPYTIGFSSCDDGSRKTSDDIEKFYKNIVTAS